MSSNAKRHKKTHNWLPLNDKLTIIKDVDSGMKQTDVAAKYNLSKSTVTMIMKHKENLIKTANSGEVNCEKRKSTKGPYNLQLEDELYKWLCQQVDEGEIITGPLIREQALIIKEKLKKVQNCAHDFKASPGWLDRFKKRYKIGGMYSGEEQLSDSFETALKFCFDFQSLLAEEEYNLHLVFGVGDTELSWKSFPDKNSAGESETDFQGGRKNEERITASFCGNATGSFRLPVLVIGKYKSPRCFKNISTLPVVYRAQKAVRLNGEIFFDWYKNCFIRSVKTMQAETGQHGKVLLLLDNALMQLSKEDFDAVDENFSVHFVPPNVTELIQPMDQGVIEKVKKIYRKNFLRSLLLFNDSASVDNFIKSFNLRDGCHFLASAFAALTDQNLKDGWNKILGLSDFKSKETSDDDSTLSLEVFSEMVNEVRGYENTTVQSTANWLADDRYDPDWEQLTEDEIIQQEMDLAEMQETSKIDKQNLTQVESVSAADALRALRTLRIWCQSQQEFTKNDFKFFKKWEKLAESHFT